MKGYIPLQPFHTGNWASSDANGEGVNLFYIAGRVFLLFFIYKGDQPFWCAASFDPDKAWQPEQKRYQFQLYQHDGVNTSAREIGRGNIAVVNNEKMLIGWNLMGGEVVVDREMLNLIPVIDGPPEACDMTDGFSPPRPRSKYCHG